VHVKQSGTYYASVLYILVYHVLDLINVGDFLVR